MENRLFVLQCKLVPFLKLVSRVDRGDLIGVLRDLLREGPSGKVGNNCAMAAVGDFRSSVWLSRLALPSSLRGERCACMVLRAGFVSE